MALNANEAQIAAHTAAKIIEASERANLGLKEAELTYPELGTLFQKAGVAMARIAHEQIKDVAADPLAHR